MYPYMNLNLNHLLSLKAYFKGLFLPLPELYLISMFIVKMRRIRLCLPFSRNLKCHTVNQGALMNGA